MRLACSAARDLHACPRFAMEAPMHACACICAQAPPTWMAPWAPPAMAPPPTATRMTWILTGPHRPPWTRPRHTRGEAVTGEAHACVHAHACGGSMWTGAHGERAGPSPTRATPAVPWNGGLRMWRAPSACCMAPVTPGSALCAEATRGSQTKAGLCKGV